MLNHKVLWFFFLLLGIKPASCQWSINSTPLDDILSVYFTNDTTGYCVGKNGGLFKTVNQGSSWNSITSPTTFGYASVHFPTDSIGFAVGEQGIIIKTSNAGNSWTIVDTANADVLISVFFANKDTGFAVGSSSNGVILKTIDGGDSWKDTIVSLPELRSVFFTSSGKGFIGGSNCSILSSNDYGMSWIATNLGCSSTLTSIFFFNDSDGFAVGTNGAILKTTDSGNTWSLINSGTNLTLNSVYFPTIDTGYIVGFDDSAFPGAYIILKSVDKGLTWKTQATRDSIFLYSTYFLNKDIGFAVGDQLILKTINGGESVGVKEYSNKGAVKIYPNPFSVSAQIKLSISNKEAVRLILYNSLGQELKIIKISSKELVLDRENLSNGMYFYRLTSKDEILETGKVVIE